MISIKPVKPKRFKIPGIKGRLERMLAEEAWIQKRMLQKTTRTWKGAKPRFRRYIEVDRDDMMMVVAPSGSEKGKWKWIWLDQGTRVRRALMSPDFKPKTRHRTMGSRMGRGGVLFVSRRIARPGIKAREWSEEAAERRTPKFIKKVERQFEIMVRDGME